MLRAQDWNIALQLLISFWKNRSLESQSSSQNYKQFN